MRQAVLDAQGRVVNIIIAPEGWPAPPGGSIRPAMAADVVYVPAEVPHSVSRFQARAALHLAGLLPSVEAAIAASGNVVAQLAWADAVAFERTSPTIAAMAAALGLSAAEVDDLFRAAAGIAA
jgi:hypothetical protein